MKDIEKEIINFSKNLTEKDIENGCQENINNFLEYKKYTKDNIILSTTLCHSSIDLKSIGRLLTLISLNLYNLGIINLQIV